MAADCAEQVLAVSEDAESPAAPGPGRRRPERAVASAEPDVPEAFRRGGGDAAAAVRSAPTPVPAVAKASAAEQAAAVAVARPRR
jgi:hypothetical protein